MKNNLQGMMEFIKKTDVSSAKSQIADLLKSGKMSKEQFNNFKAQAEGLMKLLK